MKWLIFSMVSWSSIAVAEGTLDRERVVAAMSAIRPQLGACYAKYHVAGIAVVDLTITPTGTVAAAELQRPGRGIGDIAPTSPTGICVRQAVLAARFPSFSGGAQKLAYPLVIDDRATAETPPAPSASAALDHAQQAYVAGQYADAIKLATPAKADDPPRAWRIIGAASCFLGDSAGAAAAIDALDDKGRRFVAYVCANNKVALPAR